MYIEINDTTTLQNIQERFKAYYPWLSLDFFSSPHHRYESSDSRNLLNLGRTLSTIKKTHVSGIFEILPMNRALDLEREFERRFGIGVQVLMKEHDQWKQTTGLDDLTLKELNVLSRNASDEVLMESE